jgi:O-antigen ligase
VLIPLLAALTLGADTLARRVMAVAAVSWCVIGLLLSMERSAWTATGVGLAVGFLVWQTSSRRTAPAAGSARSWRPGLVVAAVCLLVAAAFFSSTDVSAVVAPRAADIRTAIQGRDHSFNWRVQKWRGAAAMALRRPVWGWGPGQFVLQQSRFTHLGLTRDEVRRDGASFDDMAYNEYLQTAAELGFPGLLLYLLILASFFSKARHALRRLPAGLRRTTLIGCVAGVAAQMVDALANGSWRYTEVSIFFWLILGLGVAVIRMSCQSSGVQAFRHSGVEEGPASGPERLNA